MINELCHPETMAHYLYLIPLLPAITACALGVQWWRGRPLEKWATITLSLGSVAGSLILSICAFLALRSLPPEERHITQTLSTWFSAGVFKVPFAFEVDPLSQVMILVVTGIGFLIHMYSVSYMGEDEAFQKFMAWLNLFMAAMLVLVLGNNFLVMFIGWEGVGLCSWGLIGFWFKETANANAAKKAFVVNRVGDFMFITGLMTLFWLCGSQTGFYSVVFREMADKVHLYAALEHSGVRMMGIPIVTFATLCFFGGATGKSAQIPLYVWLPDAMAGPTPVSALIHAATMVTSGIYMIARLNFLFALAPATLLVVSAVGAATAVVAASIGLFQYDIKKVLAYSTVSQLGYMFLGLGAGAYAAGMFHVFTHAFFKACLFLGSGSVIHAMHSALPHGADAQDMRNMGGLKKYMPITFATFFVSVFAIAGIFPFAGFWSKDEILFKVFEKAYEGGPYAIAYGLFYVMGLAGAAMTAFYMTRQLIMTFYGEYRGKKAGEEYLARHAHDAHDDHGAHGHDDDHGHAELHDPHESPWWITVPLAVLGFGAVTVGFLGLGGWALKALDAMHATSWPLLGGLFHYMVYGAGEHLASGWDYWLEPVIREVSEGGAKEAAGPGTLIEIALAALSVGIAATSMIMAKRFYYDSPERAAQMLATYGPGGAKSASAGGRFYDWAFAKYRVDELYEVVFVDGTKQLAKWTGGFDKTVVDGIVNGIGYSVLVLRWVIGSFDKYVVDGVGVAGVAWIIRQLSNAGRRLQTGDIQTYLTGATYGALATAAIYLLMVKNHAWLHFLMIPKGN